MEADHKELAEFKGHLDKWPRGIEARKVKGILTKLNELNPTHILTKFQALAVSVRKIGKTNPLSAGTDVEKEAIELAGKIAKKWKIFHDEEWKKFIEKKTGTPNSTPTPSAGKTSGLGLPPYSAPAKLDQKRGRMATMLYNAMTESIQKAPNLDEIRSSLTNLASIVTTIEDEVSKAHQGPKYDERMKEIIMNVKKQTALGSNIVTGAMTPNFVATCDVLDLVDPEVKKKVETLKQKILDEGDMDLVLEVLPITRNFNCPKCDNDECYYTEKQTRSADEPATLFLRCKKCDTAWSYNP